MMSLEIMRILCTFDMDKQNMNIYNVISLVFYACSLYKYNNMLFYQINVNPNLTSFFDNS